MGNSPESMNQYTDKPVIEGVEGPQSLAPPPYSIPQSLELGIWGIILILGLIEVALPSQFSYFNRWVEISTPEPHF